MMKEVERPHTATTTMSDDNDQQLAQLSGPNNGGETSGGEAPRRNGRKRSKPQKAVSTTSYYSDADDDGADSFTPPQQLTPSSYTPPQLTPSPPPSNAEDDDKELDLTVATPAEVGRNKMMDILQHYRSFIQRNGGLQPAASSYPATTTLPPVKKQRVEAEGWGFEPNHDPLQDITMPGSGMIPERTMRQNNWAIKVWRDWALNRNRRPETAMEKFPQVPVDIRVADLDVMSYWLPRFIKEVRRKDKKAYPADTLMQIASGLQRYLRQVSCRSEVNFFDKYSNTFAEFRDALKLRSGELTVESNVDKYKKVQVDALNDEELWLCGYLNAVTAKGLFHIVFYHNCVEFEVSSMEEHHEMKVEQFHFALDPQTMTEYIEFRRSDQRFTNMSTKRVMRRYACPQDPRCVVKMYRTYFDLVPSSGPFYRRPLQTAENSLPRFSFNPVGINKLRETYKQMFTSDRPASVRRSGKTTTVVAAGAHSTTASALERCGGVPDATDPSNNRTTRALYDAITSKLMNSGHLKWRRRQNGDGETSHHSSSDLQSEAGSEAEQRATPSTNHEPPDDADHVIAMRVPKHVRRVVVERGGKEWTFDLE